MPADVPESAGICFDDWPYKHSNNTRRSTAHWTSKRVLPVVVSRMQDLWVQSNAAHMSSNRALACV